MRAFLLDGPYAGETISIQPADFGEPPAEIVVKARDGGNPHEISDHTHSASDTDLGPTSYLLDGTDMQNGLFQYRCG
jgi:hypothetical protein